MALATATMASVMLSRRLMLIPTTMVDVVLDMDMASAMEGLTMVDMVDMALATASMVSVMLSPRLMLIPTTMVDMVLDMDMALAMEGPTMVDMVDMDFIAIMARLYLISSTHYVDIKMLPTLLIVNKNQMIPLFSLTANF